MAAAVQTKTGTNGNERELSRSSRAKLSGRSTIPRQGIKASRNTTKRDAGTPTVNLPVTHLAAGIQVPLSESLKSRYGVGEHAVDVQFLNEIETVVDFFKIAVEQNWISAVSLDELLTKHIAGSPEQSKECFSLINQCLEEISRQKDDAMAPVLKSLESFGFQSGGCGGWEFSFGIGTGNDVDPFSECTIPKLVASECGLCVLVNDLSGLTETLKLDIIQFISFCCDLSFHASTIDMVLDEGIKWMMLGEVAELGDEAESELTKATESLDLFEKALIKHMGENYMENIFVSPEDLRDYYISHQQASVLFSKVKPLTKKNVQAFHKRISKNIETPPWLLVATELLLNHCQWCLDMKDGAYFMGHVPFGFCKPFGFDFPFEYRMFDYLHETSMIEDESGSLSIDLGDQTAQFLANLDLGENLLLFVDTQLQAS